MLKNPNKINKLEDILDLAHKDMTEQEIQKLCFEMRKLKLKDNPHLVDRYKDTTFEDCIDSSIPYTNAFIKSANDICILNEKYINLLAKRCSKLPIVFYDWQAQLLDLKNHYDDSLLSGFYRIADERMIIKVDIKQPITTLSCMAHELEHFAQLHEPDSTIKKEYIENITESSVIEDYIQSFLKTIDFSLINSYKVL